MKPIGELVQLVIQNREEKKDTLDPIVCQLVDKIFVKMALLCRGFDSFYADRNRLNSEKLQWVIAFTKRGIKHQKHIQVALNRLEMHTFPNPPQLGEFLSWRETKIQDLGFPDSYEAFSISTKINHLYSDFIYPDERVDTVINHVIRQIGSKTLREMPEKLAFKVFENYYDIACRQFMDGLLEPIKRMLPQKCESHPIDKDKSDEARKKAMEQLRSLGIKINKRT